MNQPNATWNVAPVSQALQAEQQLVGAITSSAPGDMGRSSQVRRSAGSGKEGGRC